MATFVNNVAAILSQQSSILDPSLLVPETWEESIKINGQNKITGLLEMIGGYIPTFSGNFDWEEEGFVDNTITTGGATGLAGATISLTLQAGGFNYDPTGTRSAPRGGDTLVFKSGKKGTILTKVTTTPSAHVITVAPDDVLVALVVAAGEEIMVGGYEQNSSRDNNGSKIHLTQKKTNNTITMVDMVEVDGETVTDNTRAKFRDINGAMVNTVVSRQVEALYSRWCNQIFAKLLTDEAKTNPTVTATGTVGHRGLLPDISANGISTNYTISAGITLANIDTTIAGIVKTRGPLEYMQYESNAFAQSYDDAVKGLFPNGGVVYGQFGKFGEDIAIGYGFSKFKRSKFMFHRMGMDIFDDYKVLGFTGSRYQNYATLMPLGTNKDAKTGKEMPSFCIRYKTNELADRKMYFTKTGGAPGVGIATNTIDNIVYQYRGSQGCQATGINQFAEFVGV